MRAPTAGGPGAEVTQAGELRSARIESLRAIAALGVLLGHQFVVSNGLRFDTYWDRVAMGGGFGVDLFFALTGYLLFWPFARQWFGGAAVAARPARPRPRVAAAGARRGRVVLALPLARAHPRRPRRPVRQAAAGGDADLPGGGVRVLPPGRGAVPAPAQAVGGV